MSDPAGENSHHESSESDGFQNRPSDAGFRESTRDVAAARALGRRQFLTFLLNWFPAFHVAAVVVAAVFVGRWGLLYGLFAALFVLYIAPPMAARLIVRLRPTKKTVIKPDSREFLLWWFLSCLQGVYNRFVFLEEILRLVPTVYSNWLRFWGSRIGKLAFWAPGVLVLDRTQLNIGDQVFFGAGVRIAPHIMARGSDGEFVLLFAPITIGDSTTIGGYSFLGPGTEMAAGETTRAFFISPPFSSWKDGKRTKVKVEGWEP